MVREPFAVQLPLNYQRAPTAFTLTDAEVEVARTLPRRFLGYLQFALHDCDMAGNADMQMAIWSAFSLGRIPGNYFCARTMFVFTKLLYVSFFPSYIVRFTHVTVNSSTCLSAHVFNYIYSQLPATNPTAKTDDQCRSVFAICRFAYMKVFMHQHKYAGLAHFIRLAKKEMTKRERTAMEQQLMQQAAMLRGPTPVPSPAHVPDTYVQDADADADADANANRDAQD